MVYVYELKSNNNRNNVNLIDHAVSITTAIVNVFGSNLLSVKVHQDYYEFELSMPATQSDKQRVGKEIVKIDSHLNSLKTTYNYGTQLFIEKI